MAEAYIGEIRIFAGNFAPANWALCNGQLLPLNQNTALFSILGTQYGGNGINNFALPDLRGAAPLHQGAGPGLTPRFIGEGGGANTVTLLEEQMPVHNHTASCVSTPSTDTPDGMIWANTSGRGAPVIYSPLANSTTQMNPQTLGVAGSSQPHNNMQPYLALNFIICLRGNFPPRG